MLTALEEITAEKNKIPALTEFGYGQVLDPTWWTNVFWQAIQSHRISYTCRRNSGSDGSGKKHYYLPYKGQVSEDDFKKFYNYERTLFQKDLSKINLYQQPDKS